MRDNHGEKMHRISLFSAHLLGCDGAVQLDALSVLREAVQTEQIQSGYCARADELVIFVVCIFFRNSMNDAIGWFAAWLLFVLLLFLPHYIYVRFFMPYETLSEDETRKFHELQKN